MTAAPPHNESPESADEISCWMAAVHRRMREEDGAPLCRVSCGESTIKTLVKTLLQKSVLDSSRPSVIVVSVVESNATIT
jgi:hypothetical protein